MIEDYEQLNVLHFIGHAAWHVIDNCQHYHNGRIPNGDVDALIILTEALYELGAPEHIAISFTTFLKKLHPYAPDWDNIPHLRYGLWTGWMERRE